MSQTGLSSLGHATICWKYTVIVTHKFSGGNMLYITCMYRSHFSFVILYSGQGKGHVCICGRAEPLVAMEGKGAIWLGDGYCVCATSWVREWLWQNKIMCLKRTNVCTHAHTYTYTWHTHLHQTLPSALSSTGQMSRTAGDPGKWVGSMDVPSD